VPNNICGYFSLKHIEHNSSLFKAELYIVAFFQRVHYGKGEENKLVMDKPDKYYLKSSDQPYHH
jgi:hypothetical protein